MDENNILYQISTLEKIVGREFIRCVKLNAVVNPPTPTQIKIINYIIMHKDEEIYQKDLEAVLKLRRATVSGVLQTMEKRGLITRTVSEDDSRTKKIVLNMGICSQFEKFKEKLKELDEIIKKDISMEELSEFNHILKKMQNNIINCAQKEGN